GETAENLAEELKISRADQDAFALRSHQRAVAAQKAGAFARELVTVEISQRKGEPVRVSADEGPRGDTTMEALAKLKPAFREGGSVTAGNSSTLNDGAAALVLASRAYAKAHGLPVLGVVRGATSAGVSPRPMGLGPGPAVKKLLDKSRVALADIERFELNEAFAAQSLAVVRQLGLSESAVEERVNVRGGAIALGHPLGCSGARLVATLLSLLHDEGKALGVATLCVGVGQGLALMVERAERA
ncbi:MAG: thiolase family protein, partial [Deltaproteobacteria bacterium]|nr:thiolase family protein [Deltaproteobacteria bacterium]